MPSRACSACGNRLLVSRWCQSRVPARILREVAKRHWGNIRGFGLHQPRTRGRHDVDEPARRMDRRRRQGRVRRRGALAGGGRYRTALASDATDSAVSGYLRPSRSAEPKSTLAAWSKSCWPRSRMLSLQGSLSGLNASRSRHLDGCSKRPSPQWCQRFSSRRA